MRRSDGYVRAFFAFPELVSKIISYYHGLCGSWDVEH